MKTKKNARDIKDKWKKELKSWGVFLALLAVLYFTGLGKQVVIGVQRAWLWTGFSQASEISKDKQQTISYNFTLHTLEGKKVSFEEMEGKAIFVNIWATWCPPCVAEMPNIHALYKEFENNPNVAFVMIASDEIEKVKKFIKRKSYTFPVYTFGKNVPAVLNASSLPTTFVISPNGKVVSKKEGSAQYNTQRFKDFLKEVSQRKANNTSYKVLP